jgi:hypothetical protein
MYLTNLAANSFYLHHFPFGAPIEVSFQFAAGLRLSAIPLPERIVTIHPPPERPTESPVKLGIR